MLSGNDKSKIFTINDACFCNCKLRKGFCLQIFLAIDWFANRETFSTLIEELEKKELYKLNVRRFFSFDLGCFVNYVY